MTCKQNLEAQNAAPLNQYLKIPPPILSGVRITASMYYKALVCEYHESTHQPIKVTFLYPL